MEQLERDATNASIDYVADNLYDVNLLSPKLISKSLISRDDENLIQAEKTERMKATKLIKILHGKEGAFLALLEILIAENKLFIAKYIYDEYQKRGGEITVDLKETDQILKRDGWKVSSSAFNYSAIPKDLNSASVRVRNSLQDMYLVRFRTANPFSLPFTFDIEQTWVSLALREEENEPRSLRVRRNLQDEHSNVAEDYAQLLKTAFGKANMLIIEGKPATGKTCLMRRIAYDWAKKKQELLDYDLVIYAEFRGVREQAFESIFDLMLEYNKEYRNFFVSKELEDLTHLLSSKSYCKDHHILLLIDGYDESSLEKQCTELNEYFSSTILKNPLLFNVVLTSRPGYLSKYRGQKGRFIFADVLGFATQKQKHQYISNHFYSTPELDNAEIIAEIDRLLEKNENLNKIAETPLFLTFICLVHEHIIEGTLLELYCNIIWWILDRHQKDFPARNIPDLFEYQSNSNDKFLTIQDHYLEFPQLHYLGRMTLSKLEQNVFQQSDIDQFNLKPIIEHVGLLRKEEQYESLKRKTSFFFPHRTIQEFLASFYYFASNEQVHQLPSNSKIDTKPISEFEKFLLRIALSKQSDCLPISTLINTMKHKQYFDGITDLIVDPTFDAFVTTEALNDALFNWFISHCRNIQTLEFNDLTTSSISVRSQLKFIDLNRLHSLIIYSCIFEANSQVSFSNCTFLSDVKFGECKIQSSASIEFSKLPALNNLEFRSCTIDLNAWKSITDEITKSSVKRLHLSFEEDFNNEFLKHLKKCNNVENIEITLNNYNISKDNLISFNEMVNLCSLIISECVVEANCHASFIDCPSLKYLRFFNSVINSSNCIDFSKLPALNTLIFDSCAIDWNTWQSITDGITKSSVKRLGLSPNFCEKKEISEYFNLLKKCEAIENISVYILGTISNGEEQLTTNLSNLARAMKGLKSITFDDKDERMKEASMEIIRKAGQERDPDFKIGSTKRGEGYYEQENNDAAISLQQEMMPK